MTDGSDRWQDLVNARMMTWMRETHPAWLTLLLLLLALACAESPSPRPADVQPFPDIPIDTTPPDTVVPKDTNPDVLDPQDTPDVDVSAPDTPSNDVEPSDIADTEPSDIADAVEDVVEDTLVADTTPTDDTQPPDETEICESPLSPTGTETLPISLGSAGLGGKYQPAEAGDLIEIVQGPQGGVHVEVAFEVTLPETFTKNSAKMALVAHTFQPCCMGNMVGSYTNNKFLAFKGEPGGQVFASGVVPVIFFQNEAIHYQDAECCVVLTADVFAPQSTEILASGAVMQAFTCVDYF